MAAKKRRRNWNRQAGRRNPKALKSILGHFVIGGGGEHDDDCPICQAMAGGDRAEVERLIQEQGTFFGPGDLEDVAGHPGGH